MSKTDRNRSVSSQIETPFDDASDILQQYGYLSNTFDHARDPLVSKQLNDEIADKSAQKTAGENSWMISKEQPRFINRPPEHIGKPETSKQFAKRLAEDDRISRARVKLNFGDDEADSKKHAEEQDNKTRSDAVAEIASEYDLDLQRDDYQPTNAQKRGQSQS